MTDHLGDEYLVLSAVAETQRALLALRRRADARAALIGFVERLGGRVVPAHPPAAATLPIDVSGGEGEPVVPVAPDGTPLRRHLERHLPPLVDQARHVAALVDDVGDPRDRRRLDPLTGAPRRELLARVVERAVPGEDRLVGVVVGHDGWLIEPYGRMRADGLVRDLAEVVRDVRHPVDPWGRVNGHGLAVLLLRSDETRAERFLVDVEQRWAEARRLEVDLRTLDLPVADPPAGSLDRLEVALGLAGTTGDAAAEPAGRRTRDA